MEYKVYFLAFPPFFCFLDLVVEGLRYVVLSRDLCHRFLLLAESNTVRGIETCGILCGKLVWSLFRIFLHRVLLLGLAFCDKLSRIKAS